MGGELDSIEWARPELQVQRLPCASAGVDEYAASASALWEHGFARLGVDPTEHPVLLTEPGVFPGALRRRVVELMFESYGVPALCSAQLRSPEPVKT